MTPCGFSTPRFDLGAACLKTGYVSSDTSKTRSGSAEAPKATGTKPGTPAAVEPPPTLRGKSGRVKFDERGNAVWEWANATGSFGREVTNERLEKLEIPGLSIAEDAPTPFDCIKPNPAGTVKGYNPYDSGRLGKASQPPRKRDLKKLSEWMKLKKQAANNNPDDEK